MQRTSYEMLGLRVPWTARRSNQSILKESALNSHWKDWCWSWNSNNLTIWCKSRLIRKDSNAGKDWGQEEKGMTEDEMVREHHWVSGLDQTLGDSEGQGSLACCSSWGNCIRHDLATQEQQQLIVTPWCEVNLGHRWLMFGQRRVRFFRTE